MNRILPSSGIYNCIADTWSLLAVRFLLSVAATILILTGMVKVVSAFSSVDILKVQDPVFGVRFGVLMPLVGVVEVGIGLVVLFTRNLAVAGGLVMWLGAEFTAYRAFASQLRPGSYCPCLGSLGEFLGLNQSGATWLALVMCVTLVALGLLALIVWMYAKHSVERTNKVGS